MGLFDKLFGKRPDKGGDERGYHFYVECDHCHSLIHARIDLYNDLSEAESGPGWMVRKILVDDRCFRQIEAVLRFNMNKRTLVEAKFSGGHQITRSEYEALR